MKPTPSVPSGAPTAPTTFRDVFVALVSLGVAVPTLPLPAQPETSAPVVELSPFVVNSASDVGYLATESLAGSRLNTALRDIPAPISVFTEEFLRDIGANDLSAAAEFAVNAVPYSEIETGGITGNQMQNPNLNFNIRGLRATSTRNYFNWGLNSDNYNAERLDVSRGPNSILFGISPAGGIVNTSTKQAVFREINRVGFQVNDPSGYRLTLDTNRQLVRDKLALRLNLLKSEEGTWRSTEQNDSERVHLAATYQPFRRTTVRAEAERGIVDRVQHSPWGAFDGITGWFDAGQVLIPTARGARPADSSTASVSNTIRLVATHDGAAAPTIADWRLMSRSDKGPGIPGVASLFDFSRIPRDATPRGTGQKTDFSYHTQSIYVEQTVNRDLAFELAYNRQKQETLYSQVTDWNVPVYVDVNQQLPNGQTNPRVGQFYIEDAFFYEPSVRDAETARLTGSYQLDFAKIAGDGLVSHFGRHRLAGLYQNERIRNLTQRFREVNTTPLTGTGSNTSLTNAVNFIYRRTYLDFDDSSGARGAFDPRSIPLASQALVASTGASGTVTPGYNHERVTGTERKIDTRLVALQSTFLDGRLATTFGYRRDGLETRQPVVNFNTTGTVLNYDWSAPYERQASGTTRTAGGVFHATKHISLTYSQSSNFNISSGRSDPFGTLLPNEEGESKDYGLRFRFFDDRVQASIIRYESAARNRATFTGSTGSVRTVANNIWDVVDPTRRIPTTLAIGTIEDAESDGTELEIIANPTPRWRVMFNASKSDVRVANVGSTDQAYIDAFSPLWLATPNLPVAGSTQYATVAEAIAFIQDSLDNLNGSINGSTQKGHEPYKVRFFTNYTFASDSVLKGFSAGGGVRYQSSAATGFARDSSGGLVEYKSASFHVVDLRVGYSTRIMGDRHKLSLNLNVRNVLDEDDYRIISSRADGTPLRGIFQTPPRSYQLTANLEF